MESYIESLGIEAKRNGRMYLFICFYGPPQYNVNDFDNAVNEILILIKDGKYCEVYIFGNFN